MTETDKPIRFGKLKKQYLQAIADFIETFDIRFMAVGIMVTQHPVTKEVFRVEREQIHQILQEEKRQRGFSCSRTSLTQHIDHMIDACLEAARKHYPLQPPPNNLRRIEI